MAWITPIFNRTVSDTVTARAAQANEENNKGALNYQDLNRIESNHKELMQCLEKDGYYIPHAYRNYKESFNGTTYTDWQEINIPWLSEINRIRENYTALVQLFLVGLGLPVFPESLYLNWQEVNDWERVAAVGKTMTENMVGSYPICGIHTCGMDTIDCLPYEKVPNFPSKIGSGTLGNMLIGYE
jgi:hypothetical protein